jgi:hypothetical protein
MSHGLFWSATQAGVSDAHAAEVEASWRARLAAAQAAGEQTTESARQQAAVDIAALRQQLEGQLSDVQSR